MEKLMIICLIVLTVNHVSVGVYIDDGLPHIFDDSTYWYQSFDLDKYTANTPGTHVDLVDGGEVGFLTAYNNATINMSGGLVNYSLQATDNGTITMSGGSIDGQLSVAGNSTVIITGCDWIDMGIQTQQNAVVTISGGEIGGLSAGGNSIVTISGGSAFGGLSTEYNGTIIMTGGSVGSGISVDDDGTFTLSGGSVDGLLYTELDGTIYLDGTGFEVDGTPLEYGDKLSDFGILTTDAGGYDYYGGTITGILTDGSALNNEFQILEPGQYEGTGDIYIIPEPATLLLLGLGAVMVRRKR